MAGSFIQCRNSRPALRFFGNQVHYISLTVDDSSYDIDTYYPAQSNWNQEEIDIAFQMDGNFAQQPYDVWLDEVNLNAY